MLEADFALRRSTLDLEVRLGAAPGEPLAVVGPNGAGKSTLLAALAGLIRVSRGRVLLDGRVLEDANDGTRIRPERRRIGMVFQDDLLFPHMSVLDNVAFGARARGARRKRAREHARGWLGRVGIVDYATARPDALSGGQARRAALARALASGPEALLLDEPLSALDVRARTVVRRQLRTHLEAFTGPCILVTHDAVEAMALARRVAVVDGGRIIQEGTVDEVARRPRSPWIARLVGLNFFHGRADGHEVRVRSGAVIVTADQANGSVYAVVRPSAVALHRERPGGTPRNIWRGEVDGLETGGGGRIRVHITGQIPVTAEVTPAAATALELGRGGTVWVAIKATAVEVYSD